MNQYFNLEFIGIIKMRSALSFHIGFKVMLGQNIVAHSEMIKIAPCLRCPSSAYGLSLRGLSKHFRKSV